MVDDRSEEAIITPHIAHIIRDVFKIDKHSNVVCFQGDDKLLYELRKPEHGIEAWGLHHEGTPLDPPRAGGLSRYWEIGYNDSHYGREFCDLFISLDYLTAHPDLTIQTVVTLWKLMKPQGLILLTNPTLNDANFQWGNFHIRQDLIDELRSYTLFAKKKNVLVLQNDI